MKNNNDVFVFPVLVLIGTLCVMLADVWFVWWLDSIIVYQYSQWQCFPWAVTKAVIAISILSLSVPLSFLIRMVVQNAKQIRTAREDNEGGSPQ